MNALFLSALLAATGPDLDVIAKAQKAAGIQLTSDTTLARGATCLAKFARKGQPLTAALVRFCADATGVYESVLVPLIGETNSSHGLLDSMTKFFQNEGRSRGLTHYGAANARNETSQTIAILASMRRGTLDVQTADMCKQKHARFSGEFFAANKNLKALLTLPNGKTNTLDLTLQGRSFRGDALFDMPGKYQLEIVGETKEGPHVIANRALFVCTRMPDAPSTSIFSTETPKPERVLDLMNADRKKAGLAAVQIDARVSAVAEAHATDMRERGYFAHNSPDGSTLSDRLKRAKIPYVRATENLSSAPTADDAELSLMGSPGHRKNILDPEVTHVGVGIAFQPLSNGSPNYLFVTNYIAKAESLDPNAFRQTLLTTLNQERATARLQPVKLDADLGAIADQQSSAMSSKDKLAYFPDEAHFFGEVRAIKGNVELDADLFMTNDPTSLRKSANVQKSAKAVGIGIASAPSKRYGDNVYWVTIIYVR